MLLNTGVTTRQFTLDNGKTFVRALHVDANTVPTSYFDVSAEPNEQVYPVPEKNVLHTADCDIELHVKTAEEGGKVIVDNLGNQYLQINGVS